MFSKKPAPEILAITDAFPPLKGGGTAYAFNAILGMPFRVLVLCPFGSDRPGGSVHVKRVFYTNFQIHNRYLRKLYSVCLYLQLTLIPLFWAFRNWQHLKVVVCFQIIPAGIAGYLIHRFFRIPFVVVTYGEELTLALQKRICGWHVHTWLWKLVLSKAARIATMSSFTRTVLGRFDVDVRRVCLIPLGIQGAYPVFPSDNILRLLAEHGLERARLILMVGRLIERKGFDNAIRAFSEIVVPGDRLHLLIVGAGEQEEFLKDLAKKITQPGQVVFLGSLADDDVRYLYSICEVFLLPVRSLDDGDTEGFGMVFIEAGIHGKPIVAGRAGGTPEAVVDGVTGLLVDGSSTDEIKDALLRVLNDRDLAARLGEEGRRRALEGFSIERQQERFNGMIREFMAPSPVAAQDRPAVIEEDVNAPR